MKILLVTDSSNFSEKAIDACQKIVVHPETTSFKIISAVEFPTMLPSDPFIGASADYYDRIEEAGQNQAKEFIAQAAARRSDGFTRSLPELAFRRRARRRGKDRRASARRSGA